MQLTVRNIVLIVLVVLALGLFLRATLGGGKMIGGFLDKRARRSDDGEADDAGKP